MTGAGGPDALADAVTAARLCALDPGGLGGLLIRGDRGRDAIVETLRAALPPGAPLRRLPAHVDDERLLGGLDLAAALGTGAARVRPGLLAEADGGLLVAPMAERMSEAVAARLAATLDAGSVPVERDGMAARLPARIAVAALDEGVGDEGVPAALADRLAFHVDLTGASGLIDDPGSGPTPVSGWPAIDNRALTVLVATAEAFGVEGLRAPLLALRAARAATSLGGKASVGEAELTLAARLVLAPRATRLPSEDAASPAPPPPEDGRDGEAERADGPLEERVIASVRAALPPDLLAGLAAGRARGIAAKARGGAQRAGVRGRPAGARAGLPRGGLRLSLIETLRAATPWQRLRGREPGGRVRLRRDDLRVKRHVAREELVTIFLVDASGSAALARLGEAKGAVELLLAHAYVKRAQVALVAFRGTGAELLLPPTRSLARAKRALAELPGGGGTPLAAGLTLGRALARGVAAKGRTPFLVLLTDGRANVAADGTGGRVRAEADALAAGKLLAADGIAAVLVDTAPRQRPEGAALAAAMGARYLPLPQADAAAIEGAVRASRPR